MGKLWENSSPTSSLRYDLPALMMTASKITKNGDTWSDLFNDTLALEAHRGLTDGSVDVIGSEGIFTFPYQVQHINREAIE